MPREFASGAALGAALIAALIAAPPAFSACTVLDFEGDRGGLLDRNGVGTGFTHITEPNTGDGYLAERLELRDGELRVRTGSGIQWLGADSLVNGLGDPVPDGHVFTTETTLLEPPAGSRSYEQAGLWIGKDQDNYAKLVYNSPPSKLRIEFTLELGGGKTAFHRAAPRTTRPRSVRLLLRRDRSTGRLSAWYAVNGDPLAELGSISVPDDFGATGSDSHAGIFATHRRGSRALIYRFADFAAICHLECADPDRGGDPGPGKIDLDERRQGTGRHGTRPFTAHVSVPRRVTIERLHRGIFIHVRCSARCGVRANIGSVRGRSRSRAAGKVRVRLAASERATRRLRRLARASPNGRVRRRVRTVVSGPWGQRVRSMRTIVLRRA